MKLWRERIAEAKARGKFTDKDCEDANEWDHCKVSERFSADPDYRSPAYGTEARLLGVEFGDAVIEDNFDKAAELCAKIDALTDWRKK